MTAIFLSPDADYETWRNAARPLLQARIAPEDVQWSVDQIEDLFPSAAPSGRNENVRIARAFHELALDAALHCDTDRFALLYRLAWRLQFQPQLMTDATDSDVARLTVLAHNVRREVHKMHAYVRFRAVPMGEGTRFIAWHEPKHYVLRRATPFFVERFASMHWAILTPIGSAEWDTRTLSFGEPATRADAPSFDDKEDEWRAYYSSIFNPARLNTAAMLRHMPKRYWATMPETDLIPDLIRTAALRTDAMVEAAPTEAARRSGRLEAAATAAAKSDTDDAHGGTPPDSLAEMRAKLPACRACPLYKDATQAVPGEGPANADIMLVGEQPGDQEDLAGKPFVGPAGQVLDKALAAAGIDRARVYVTNAVKHFKFELRGKRRLHKSPGAGEVTACRWWLNAERSIIRPDVTVALGATALSSLAGPKATLKSYRGGVHDDGAGGKLVATYHPSFILRIPDEEGKSAAMKTLIEDLRQAGKAASQAR